MKDPESSELGKQLVKSAIDLIYELGFEHFTFKKLAAEVNTTEATVYRYFENKHRMLLYILNWYWSYMEFLVVFRLQNITDAKVKLETIIELLTQELPESSGTMDYNKRFLNQIVISESSKVYLVKEVKEINKSQVFKAYKDLCARIALVVSEYNPDYQYPRSLSSTLIETSHFQQFFCTFLPKLTDVDGSDHKKFTAAFLSDLLFKALG
ncbi:TetR/AcrR family transcriptional regulator [Dyadobacter crusticola]|uniref:TetR/AcrR family transcriptional regulator n=1 Tax=Dyadobacter crusticola TaxID=292407 RepID=UPI000AC7D718|nr:TetR/AcrR family transcriptional regulator [Dyadobacter crusticola]